MIQRTLAHAGLALLTLALAACERFPEDPESSLERARAAGELRVGAIASEPWVKFSDGGAPKGVEAMLINEFARELGLKVSWQRGGAEELLGALERHELDVVIGGITRANPWKKRVGFTVPYYVSRWLIGASAAEASGFDPSDKNIHVRAGDGLIRKVEKKGAIAEVVAELNAAAGLIAAEAWKIETLGLHPTDVELKNEKHAMAVAPGENALLTRLDTFLLERASKERVKALLREADG